PIELRQQRIPFALFPHLNDAAKHLLQVGYGPVELPPRSGRPFGDDDAPLLELGARHTDGAAAHFQPVRDLFGLLWFWLGEQPSVHPSRGGRDAPERTQTVPEHDELFADLKQRSHADTLPLLFSNFNN